MSYWNVFKNVDLYFENGQIHLVDCNLTRRARIRYHMISHPWMTTESTDTLKNIYMTYWNSKNVTGWNSSSFSYRSITFAAVLTQNSENDWIHVFIPFSTIESVILLNLSIIVCEMYQSLAKKIGKLISPVKKWVKLL